MYVLESCWRLTITGTLIRRGPLDFCPLVGGILLTLSFDVSASVWDAGYPVTSVSTFETLPVPTNYISPHPGSWSAMIRLSEIDTSPIILRMSLTPRTLVEHVKERGVEAD